MVDRNPRHHLPHLGHALLLLCAACPTAICAAEAQPIAVLHVPVRDASIALSLPLPTGFDPAGQPFWQLQELGNANTVVPVQLVPSTTDDGSLQAAQGALVAQIAPQPGAFGARCFQLVSTPDAGDRERPVAAELCWQPLNDASIRLSEGSTPVLQYNHGPLPTNALRADDRRRARAGYVHPLWGMQGETLTADFPADHVHHHGLFWAWKHVTIAGQTYNMWEFPDVEHRFVQWICREAGPHAAVLGVENGWFLGQHKVMVERVWLRVYPAEPDCRAMDLQLTLIPTDQPVSLQGDEGKSYGGVTLRFDVWPRRDAVIRTAERTVRHVGEDLVSSEDLSNTPLPWADLSSQFPAAEGRSGAAVLVHPQHPHYPPAWLARCYGALCVGWPGTVPLTLQPGVPVTLNYRVWIHRHELQQPELRAAYESYLAACAAAWDAAP